MKKQKSTTTPEENEKEYRDRKPKTAVESNTAKRPEKDTNPLPPNPNKVDNHED
ncbi:MULTISPECIES: hypothetical protein [Sphingobacterium]|uniref:hypothetical protein n=1 Tax=Sphingobacterium TaxID=28453 RepID=UPI0013DA6A87|nr:MULTISPECIES: hypothetical protein [unclassified Sphingobacterium]